MSESIIHLSDDSTGPFYESQTVRALMAARADTPAMETEAEGGLGEITGRGGR